MTTITSTTGFKERHSAHLQIYRRAAREYVNNHVTDVRSCTRAETLLASERHLFGDAYKYKHILSSGKPVVLAYHNYKQYSKQYVKEIVQCDH